MSAAPGAGVARCRRVRARPAVAAAMMALSAFASSAHAASAPVAFPAVDGTVHAAVVAGNTLYIGGRFSTVGAAPRFNLAAINLATGAVRTDWIANVTTGGDETQAQVYALALSAAGGVLFVGGDFDTVRGAANTHLAAVSAATGAPVTAWAQAAAPNAPVLALARSQDGLSLYAGGGFTQIGDMARTYLAGINPANGTLLPWEPTADAAVRALAIDNARGRLYAGGGFTLIGATACNRLAAIGLANARADTGFCSLHGLAGTAVHALAYADDRLYVGGEFSGLAGQIRNNLAVLDLSGGGVALDALDPGVNGAVRALAPDGERRRLYAGGEFTAVTAGAGPPRRRLAAFRLDPLDGTDERLLAWNPGANAAVRALAVAAGDALLLAGGDFGEAGGLPLGGLAALPVAPPVTNPDPPGGGHPLLVSVVLGCEDRSGAGCARICYSVTAAPPADNCVATPPDGVEVVIDQEEVTELRFFSEDADGNREAGRSERYVVDNEAPATNISPPQLPDGEWYGAATLEPVAMACVDDHVEFGCATHYTLDGSEPTTASTRYTTPVSLASLLPPVPDGENPIEYLSDVFTLRVFSIDDAGNREETQERVYRVDLAAPVVTPSLPSGTFVAPATLALECDDGSGSGCAAMHYTTDNQTPSDGTVLDGGGNPIPATARYEGPLTLTGATVLRVHAVDNAGNASSRIVGVYALSEDTRETRSGVGAMDWALWLALLVLLPIRIKETKRVRRESK